MKLLVIPARLDSTRLPRKLLAPLGDKPLLWWTWQKALQCKSVDKVVIATDSIEILEVMEGFGAECLMTSAEHTSGSERVYEAAMNFPEADIIINLQGDEPFMSLDILSNTIDLLVSRQTSKQLSLISTASTIFSSDEDYKDTSCVKVVCNGKKQALYFSRGELAGANLHLGLYIFSQAALKEFCDLPRSELEVAERLEQLRAIENNIPVYVYHSANTVKGFGVDTLEDLARANQLLAQDSSL